MPDKLTDLEIVKALECCSSKNINACDDCPFYEKCEQDENICIPALDLINRQKSQIIKEQNKNSKLRNKINRQKAENEKLTIRLRKAEHQLDDAMKMYNTIKAEAYKECIEKVKEEIYEALKSNYKARAERIDKHNIGDKTDFISYCGGKIDCLRGLEDFLDNLLKELVGEDNGEEKE